MAKCKFCEKTFSDIYVMARHQRVAKYCLKIQESYDHCDFCDKNVNDLNVHKLECVEYNVSKTKRKYEKMYKSKIKDLKEQIRKLEKEVDKSRDVINSIAHQPKISDHSITNVTDNKGGILYQDMKPLTEDIIKENADKLTIEHIKNGARGYAEFTLNTSKDHIKCTDKARKVVVFKDDDNNIIRDVGGNILCQQVVVGTTERFNTLRGQIFDEIEEMEPDQRNQEYMKIAEHGSIRYAIAKNNLEDGDDADKFKKSFAKEVCQKIK